MTPILYVKTGCPYCAEAMDYLDQKQIAYQKVDVRNSDAGMKKLQELSGQTKTPTLDWDGKILADFGTDELEKFLQDKTQA
ncbi:MAG: glutaredoxin family protein [Verrucomicrobiota bacterium]|nr:glutaredoxin family protein [Verrucomicrobiota bacterium]